MPTRIKWLQLKSSLIHSCCCQVPLPFPVLPFPDFLKMVFSMVLLVHSPTFPDFSSSFKFIFQFLPWFYWFIPHIYIIFVHLNITTATKRRLQGFEPAARLGVLGVPSHAGPNAGLEGGGRTPWNGYRLENINFTMGYYYGNLPIMGYDYGNYGILLWYI